MSLNSAKRPSHSHFLFTAERAAPANMAVTYIDTHNAIHHYNDTELLTYTKINHILKKVRL